MKNTILILLVITANTIQAQNNSSSKNLSTMKLNAGVLTDKLEESKAFYTKVLDFGISFENDFYLLLHTADHSAELSFLLPDHPTQHPFFHRAYSGYGMYLTIEVEDVDAIYEKIKKLGIEIKVDIRDEVWGDRHFAIEDPNGIGIDLVRYEKPTEIDK